jgi:DNA uptake protein ComE-like DNA-binding protein
MKTLSDKLVFTRSQRMGIVSLLLLIFLVQLLIVFSDFNPKPKYDSDALAWEKLQVKVDSIAAAQKSAKPKLYPFNPNFITDYKGYRLGMSIAEIDRLHAFREKNLYVNSADDFKNVTGVSDSLLAAISPYFKFPDWVSRKSHYKNGFARNDFKNAKIVPIDINSATEADLTAVYGIGEKLSQRILAQKTALGGFVSMEQMKDVWGLSPQVVAELNLRFDVKSVPAVRKIAINEVSLKELSAFPYFRYKIAKSIVTYRSMNGKIENADDLVKIPDFPVDNVKIISLYLEY